VRAVKNGEYELIVAPDDYPGKKYRGRYAYEHRVAYWRKHGVLPPVVHHENEKKRDNDPKNLVGKERGAHTAEHTRERRNQDVVVTCGWCGAKLIRPHHDIAWRIKAGQLRFYCNRSHGARAQWRDGRTFQGK
jgi:hypothetical protein